MGRTSGTPPSTDLASELTDPYVVANVALCLVCLAAHVAVRLGWAHTPAVAFVLFPPTLLCFGATMATHPDARVKRLGPVVVSVRMSGLDVVRTTPRWSLAVTGAFLLYIALDFYGARSASPDEARFAAAFTAVCAHLAWSGVGTRIGGLRVAAQRAHEPGT